MRIKREKKERERERGKKKGEGEEKVESGRIRGRQEEGERGRSGEEGGGGFQGFFQRVQNQDVSKENNICE